MAKLMTQQQYLDKCIEKYGDEFDYRNVKYINAKCKIIIGCKKHGWFEIPAWKHYGNTKGCPKCGREFQGKNKTKTTESFIKESTKVHNNLYNYSKSNYCGSDSKIEIICKRHGSFWQRPANHLYGNGCIKCGNLHNTEKFIEKATKIHGNLYDYSLTKYEHNRKDVEIKCLTHGIFKQRASSHLEEKGCPICNLSKGELRIKRWLENKKIEFIPQKEFDDCINDKTGYKLRYDFYVPSKNLLIEYDGKQHFFINKDWTKETEKTFANRQFKDEVKTKYAADKKIDLLRVKYTQFKQIEKILEEKYKVW